MGVFRDVRFGLRTMIKNPTVTLVALAALSVGIGLNTAVFSLVNAVLVKGLPFEDPHEIVHLNSRNLPAGREQMGVSYPDFLDWKEQARSFRDLAGHSGMSANLSSDDRFPERVSGERVTANTFSLIGQGTLLGRDFTAADARPGAEAVVLISYSLWQNRYGGDPAVLGTTLKANEVQYSIIGIMPQGMEFPSNDAVWFPWIPAEADEDRSSRSLQVFGRLGPEVSFVQAQAEMESISGRLAEQYPDTNKDVDVLVRTSSQHYNGGEIRVVFLALMGAVTFVLLIACANVANLLLSQALGRSRETSIRTAMGASRFRVVRQMLIESLLLSMTGALAGLGLAALGVRAFGLAVADVGKPYWIDFSMDFTVFGYLAVISVGTAVLFGTVPALQATRSDINDSLKDGGRATMGGGRSRRLTSALVVAELSLTLILLVGDGLMTRSFMNLQQIDLGFDASDLLTLQLTLPTIKYPETADRLAFEERLLEELLGIPGVEAAALTSNLPATGAMNQPFALVDRDLRDADGDLPTVSSVAVSTGYFETFGSGVIEGRSFSVTDGGEGSKVAIVNKRFADKYWPGEDPLGRNLRLGGGDDPPLLTIVGVAPPIRQRLRQGQQFREVDPTVFIPYSQQAVRNIGVAVRSRIDSQALATSLRSKVSLVDPGLPTFNVRGYDEMIAQSSWPYRVFGSIFGILAFIALVLSSVGIFGVTSYSVGQRTPEIGMRMALGAASTDVLWLVGKQGLKQLGAGLVLGLLGAFAITRVLSDFMFGVGTTDPTTFFLLTLLLSFVTLSACLVPARRATRLDPMDALRIE